MDVREIKEGGGRKSIEKVAGEWSSGHSNFVLGMEKRDGPQAELSV